MSEENTPATPPASTPPSPPRPTDSEGRAPGGDRPRGGRPGGDRPGGGRPGGRGRPGGGRGGPRGGGRRFGRRKVCRFCLDKVRYIDWKDSRTLRHYITDRAKIVPRRTTGNCAKHQRQLTQAIKRARQIALLPQDGQHRF